MHSIDPHDTPRFDPLVAENDELVRRLRALKWTEVDPRLRFRCWEAFSKKLNASGPPAAAGAGADSRDIYEFSRSEGLRRATPELRLPPLLRRASQGPGTRLDVARPLSRRAGLDLATRVA